MFQKGKSTSLPSSMYLVLLMLLPAALFVACSGREHKIPATQATVVPVKIDHHLSWGERMALSIMKRNPHAWMIDSQESPQWNYTNGLVMYSFLKLWENTGNAEYYNYAKSYADTLIDREGTIRDYDLTEFNIDNVNPGKILFTLYGKTKDPRYDTAIKTLRNQLKWQPRTTEGGFWHKLRYPWQMWLDGLYMGAPFYTEYAIRYHEPAILEDVVLQFRLIEQHMRNTQTGLLYHGWDESKVQRWADPATGCSPHYWARAMGWYGMALTDVIDFLPEASDARKELSVYLNHWIQAIATVQEPETGLWYQILDRPEQEGNYLEATASCMFVYTILHAINQGVAEDRNITVARKGYEGILKNFIEVDGSGEVHLHKCCSVAGLGGTPYRDGSMEYYLSEKVRSNDPKGTGPFILAALEMERYEKNIER